ncbi:putative LRR receptor serine/threonine-protein kinase [Trifolium repens]|nr:putative LRR receptor serine/threonine-protein kinase [Trifolium repens]
MSYAKFIDTGVSKSIAATNETGVYIVQQLRHVRSFPSGVRNCYKINVTSGTKYLIKAYFYYGNYDNLNQPPQFDLLLGANVWDTLKFPNASILRPLNTGNGTPFISAIELRPLNNTIYATDSANSVSFFERSNLGSKIKFSYRYKNDVQIASGLWTSHELSSDWRGLSNSANNINLSFPNPYKPPAIVMSTAVTPVIESVSLHVLLLHVLL